MTHQSTPSHMSDSTYRKTICGRGISDIPVYVLTEPELIYDAFEKASLPFSQEERGDTTEVLRRMSDEWMFPRSLYELNPSKTGKTKGKASRFH